MLPPKPPASKKRIGPSSSQKINKEHIPKLNLIDMNNKKGDKSIAHKEG
jgi:hypothetical protein